VSQIALANSRRTTHRNAAALRGIAALHAYSRARGLPAEADYNLGRAAHEMGQLHIAAAHYERALAAQDAAVAAQAPAVSSKERIAAAAAAGSDDERMEDPLSDEGGEVEAEGAAAAAAAAAGGSSAAPAAGSGHTIEEQAQLAGAAREAAFNLAHIYRRSGAGEMARQVMQRYLVF